MNENPRHFQRPVESVPVTASAVIHSIIFRWRILAACVGILWAMGLAYHFIIPRHYTAQAQFYYVDSLTDRASSPVASGLASLAAVAGLGTQQDSARQIAIATLESNRIAEQFIIKFNLLPTLFPEKWDDGAHRWKVSRPPTPADAVGRLERIRSIKDDASTGALILAITLPDRKAVAPLANGYVHLADDALRARALKQSTAAVNYLQSQVSNAATVELKDSLINLMQSQFLHMTESKTSPEFAFQVVDPATPPLVPDGPRLILLLAILTVAGVLLGSFAAVWLELRALGLTP